MKIEVEVIEDDGTVKLGGVKVSASRTCEPDSFRSKGDVLDISVEYIVS